MSANSFISTAFQMADAACDLHNKINAAYALFSLMEHAYFSDAPGIAVKYMTLEKWEEMQNNIYTLFDMVIAARDDSKQLQEAAEGLTGILQEVNQNEQ